MEKIMKENERLKKEVEYLTRTLKTVWDGFDISVDYWRKMYLDLLRCSLVGTSGRDRVGKHN